MTNAQKIRMVLAYKKMKESELARLLGTTPQAFNQRMKTDKFSTEDLNRIAEALGVSLEYLISGQEHDRQPPITPAHTLMKEITKDLAFFDSTDLEAVRTLISSMARRYRS